MRKREGSGAGSVPHTNRSGWPKNVRIPNTAFRVFSDSEHKIRHKIRYGNYLDTEKRFPDDFFLLTIKHAFPRSSSLLGIPEISNNARLASEINPDRNP
jgi:hypothetical protein